MFRHRPRSQRLVPLLVLGIFLFAACVGPGSNQPPNVGINCLGQSPDAGTVGPDASADGTWLQFRGDRRLTARSALVGDIACPGVLWNYDLGARKTWTAVKLDPGLESVLDIPDGGEIESRRDGQEFEVDGFLIDLDGDGRNMVSPSNYGNHKVGDYLPRIPGYERISCDTGGFQSGRGGDAPLSCYLQNRQDGEWQTIWKSRPIDGFSNSMSTNGEVLVGDFDSDGRLEAAVLPWWNMVLLDLETGDIEQTGNFQKPRSSGDATSGRAYGWFGAFNLDDDPRSEFVILGDFEMFISVIGWRDGELVELWDHQIEAGTTLNRAAHDPGVNPVADIDGDGRPEIVTSIFNENGDGRWHVVGFDGLTGDIKIDLADAYLTGLGDINSDGISELFVSKASGRVVPEFGDIAIYSLIAGSPSVVWSKQGSGFETYDIPRFPDNVNSRTTHYRKTLFLRDDWTAGPAVFVTREKLPEAPGIRLRFQQVRDGMVTEIGSVAGADVEVTAMASENPELGILVQSVSRNPGENRLELSGIAGTVVHSGRTQRGDGNIAAFGSLLTGTVAGSLSAGNSPTIIAQGYGEQVIALQTTSEGNGITQIWRTGGRGMISGSDTVSKDGFASPLLADIAGTGELAVIVADQLPDGRAIIKALDGLGRTIWQTPFGVPGEPPIWNEGGITNWMAGNFTSEQYEDVLVSVRTGKMHTDQLFLLDGRSGEIVWTREFGGYYSGCRDSSGAGGTQMPAFDWDDDGLDDVLNFYSSLFAVYDGQDGSLLINRWTTGWCPSSQQLFSEGFLKSPVPVVADFMNRGDEQVLFAGTDATLALLELDGGVIWQTPFFSGTPGRTVQGVGDIDGDSGLDIVSVGRCGGSGDEIRVYNAQTGAVRWTLSLPQLCDTAQDPTSVSMADIDGDGRDEALFSQGNVLYALGENQRGEGEVLWRATFGSDPWQGQLGDVVIADVDGSGRPQIIVNTASGYLFGLGSDR